MSVVHPAVSHNYENMGYYPTDMQSMACIWSSVKTNDTAKITIFDPCCGEGTAVVKLKRELGQNSSTVGIELDESRFAAAEQVLDHCVNSDAIMQVKYTRNCVSMLFLNPPYGQSSIDERLEYAFIKRYIHSLRNGGIMALVIPSYIVNKKLASYLCGYFDKLTFGLSPEQGYRQMIVMGRKIKRCDAVDIAKHADLMVNAAKNNLMYEPPMEEYTLLPDASKFELYSSKMSHSLVGGLVERHKPSTLWGGFKRDFIHARCKNLNPLMPLSDWHTAQTILAGMVSGLIESNQRKMLIKGTVRKVMSEVKVDGQKAVQVEKFEPVIIGLDVTKDGHNFGQLFEIK